MAGYMFVNEGEEVIVPNHFWGNYNLILGNAYGAKLKKFNLFKNGGFDIDAFSSSLNEGEVGKKVVILNFPNNIKIIEIYHGDHSVCYQYLGNACSGS